MGKRKIIYAEFIRDGNPLTSQVSRGRDGMWYLRKTDIFNRKIRYNPKLGILEVEDGNSWDVYEQYLYGANACDSNGDGVVLE